MKFAVILDGKTGTSKANNTHLLQLFPAQKRQFRDMLGIIN